MDRWRRRGGLVFIGATNDSRFRAFDKDTGKELWTTKLPASAFASPMTFRGPKTGRQFIVIAAGGGNKYSKEFSDSLVAFTLPAGPDDGQPQITYSKAVAREAAPQIRAAQAKPARPELFQHNRHAALKIECTFCHQTAANGDRAGFPTASRCVTCHKAIATDHPDIQRLASIPASEKIVPAFPIYRLPDFVTFRHSQHAKAGIACANCHGDVWAQQHMAPVLEMKMKACVDCHQARRASVTCTKCHELSQ